MEGDGWRGDRLALLRAPRGPGGRRCGRGGHACDVIAGLREEWLRETPEIVAEGLVEMLQRADALLNAATATRASPRARVDGAIAAMCAASERGRGRRDDRGRLRDRRASARIGLGRAVVAAALAAGARRRARRSCTSTPTTRAPRAALRAARLQRARRRSTASTPPNSPDAAALVEPAAAGEVGRLAQVAREGGVGDDARVPGARVVRARPRPRGRCTSPCPRRRARRARRVNGPPRRRRSSATIRSVTRSSTATDRRETCARRRSPSSHCGSAVSNGMRRRIAPGQLRDRRIDRSAVGRPRTT